MIIRSKKLVVVIMSLLLLGSLHAVVNAEDFSEFSGLNQTAQTDNTYDTTKIDLVATIGNIVRTVLSVLGIIMLCIIVIAFILMNNAGGNDQEVEKAKKWIKNSMIGLIIIMSAYAITVILVTLFSGSGSNQIFNG